MEKIDPPVRKTISLPESSWARISKVRHREEISTEAEAVRRIVEAGLRAFTRDKAAA